MRGVVLSAFLLTAAVSSSAQDWKGYGRVEGRVLDADGRPVAKAKVRLDLPERAAGGPQATTDAKGRWAVAGIAAGAWEVDYEAEGYVTLKARFRLPSESARLLPLEARLRRGAEGVPPEVAGALASAEAAEKEGRLGDARAGYERLIALRPEVAAIAHQRIGATFIKEKQYGPALEHFQKARDAEPGNATVRLIMAQAAFEGGMAERGAALAAEVDRSAIRDPDVAYNLGAQLLNAGKAAEAKADLQKVLDLAPSGPQAELARKAVEQLK